MENSVLTEQKKGVSGNPPSSLKRKKVVLYLKPRKGWNVLPPELRGDVSRELGPSYEPAPSRSVCRGLNPHLEKFFLPDYVGVNYDSAEFPAKATEYWNNWGKVAREEGTELDITTYRKQVPSAHDPGVLVEVDFPLVVEDYIDYNMIMQNPKVGKTKEDLEHLENWEFYIVDLEEKEKEEEEVFKIKDNANLIYSQLVADFETSRGKILQILQMVKEPTDVITDASTDMELRKMLYKAAMKEPQKNEKGGYFSRFVQVATDPSLEQKSLIVEMLSYGILTKEGNTYFNGDESLGSLKETIAKFKEKTYSGELLKLMSKLEDARKK